MQILRDNYADMPNSELSKILNKTVRAVTLQAMHLDVKKSDALWKFKKEIGHRSYKAIGTVVVNQHGYLVKKINDDYPLKKRWRYLHHVVWEETNGPIPEGHILRFRDGNKLNTELSNLELCTYAEVMASNSIRNLPPDLQAAYRALWLLKRRVRKHG